MAHISSWLFLETRSIWRPVQRHARFSFSSSAATTDWRDFKRASSEIIHAASYDFADKNSTVYYKANTIVLHTIWISGGWLLSGRIDRNRLRCAIQSSLSVFPWISSRFTAIDTRGHSIDYSNQGVKFEIVYHPQLSIHPADACKHDNLQTALKPHNRNIFFTEDKPHLAVKRKEWPKIPMLTVQLNYLNAIDAYGDATEATEDHVEDGCVITFKLSHGFGDGYTGYLYMRYLSDFLCNNSSSLRDYKDFTYPGVIHRHDYAAIDRLMATESESTFDAKYGLTPRNYQTGVCTAPYIDIYKHSKFQTLLMKLLMRFFHLFVSIHMDYIELRFTENDIQEIRQSVMNELKPEEDEEEDMNKIRFSTYEIMVSYLSLFLARYESSTGKLEKLQIPLNLRNRFLPHIHNDKTLGNSAAMLAVGLSDNMEYKASNFARQLNDCLNVYARKVVDEDVTRRVKQLTLDFYVMTTKYEGKYNLFAPINKMLKNETVLWNEFRSLKLYEQYRFGLLERPLLYMYGTHLTGNRFMLLETPESDDNGIIVTLKMRKQSAKKFKQNETEFIARHAITFYPLCVNNKNVDKPKPGTKFN